MIAVPVIIAALALGYIVGAAHATGRIHDRKCSEWTADLRARAMAPAFAPRIEPPTIDLRPLADDAEVAMFERELSGAVLQ
ncbi:MAG TPA: hypothetical protein VL048_05940 [Xanthobacteraceae bacterium]|nr:hypothetical protein [Xanthobacteraceae bacterium]